MYPVRSIPLPDCTVHIRLSTKNDAVTFATRITGSFLRRCGDARQISWKQVAASAKPCGSMEEYGLCGNGGRSRDRRSARVAVTSREVRYNGLEEGQRVSKFLPFRGLPQGTDPPFFHDLCLEFPSIPEALLQSLVNNTIRPINVMKLSTDFSEGKTDKDEDQEFTLPRPISRESTIHPIAS